MTRRTATLAVVGIVAWASIVVSQMSAVAAQADDDSGPGHGRIEASQVALRD